MFDWSVSRIVRALVLAGMGCCVSGAVWAQSCSALRDKPLVPADTALCKSLSATVADPSGLPLNEYEDALSKFFDNWCHRDTGSGWVRDKFVRDTGPYTASRDTVGKNGEWVGTYHGTHSPVVIWYSPTMVDWLSKNRGAEASRPAKPAAIPDGAIMVKEMYPQPAAACAKENPLKLWPTSGAAIMVRDRDASFDGWFWGWYGWPTSGWTVDWPAGTSNGPPNMGFGQYCVNCHGSAKDMTFAELRNLKGKPGQPEVFLSQDFFAGQYLGQDGGVAPSVKKIAASNGTPTDIHSLRAQFEKVPEPLGTPRDKADPDMAAILTAFAKKGSPFDYDLPSPVDMPSQTYDNVWMDADGPSPHSQFMTSDQCVGCHDAGSTGLQFDMAMPDPYPGPDGDLLLSMAPYATWRSSPMGLAGRDPIFFAQMASEVQTFHSDSADLVQNTCFGCHGIMGQRQFQINHNMAKVEGTRAAQSASGKNTGATGDAGVQVADACGNFTRDIVNAIPYPANNPAAGHASYGALARDGISCMACHQMVLGKDATAQFKDAPQNACVLQRQATLNPNEKGFAKTFTGSFLVGDANTLYGPFEKPQKHPMEYTLGITPAKGDAIKTSEMCGTCHTVHLPVLKDGKNVGTVYEQTTYAEWAFSAFRTGYTIDGELPVGAGKMALSCQECHMPSGDDKAKFRSKIASIQEYSNFPAAANTFGPELLDLEQRDGFARHTLVGLNLFLVEMFQQFPEVMGIPTADPMLGKKGVDPLAYTERAMVKQARSDTVNIDIKETVIKGGELTSTVAIASLTGHKFPSGVGFRRAFVTFEVLDKDEKVIWASGRVNGAGVIVDQDDKPINGELWWDDQCKARIDPLTRAHQPHYQTVTAQDQAQIYQELVSTPPLDDSQNYSCGHNVAPKGQLTTSFLSICAEVKDNRLPPAGYLGVKDRKAIAKALGAGDDLAEDAGFTAIDNDPDYTKPSPTGGDHVTYKIKLSDMSGKPASVRAKVSYQATPPFYLQDRFCTAKGDDTERLAYLVEHLNLDDTAAENWAFEIVNTGAVAIK
ncbi:hypothetical protein [Thalassospira lucentensis]|uniref:hypothetical protein n=1 Tax=Thalassospira lucentensis TaxID=168935 RepID=UPI003AA7DFA9